MKVHNMRCLLTAGIFKPTGLQWEPKSIWTDRFIGTRKGIGFWRQNKLTKNNKQLNQCWKAEVEALMLLVMRSGAMASSRLVRMCLFQTFHFWKFEKDIFKSRWNAVCGESRMYGVEWGKIQKHKKQKDYLSLWTRQLQVNILPEGYRNVA